jgi:hypothetical protein
MRSLILAGLLLTASCVPVFNAPGIPRPSSVSLPGGSTYLVYSGDSCSGVIRNYDTETALIQDNLKAMYAGGQRRLSIMGTYLHEPQIGAQVGCTSPGAAGVNLSSDLSNVDQQYYDNLARYVKDASAIGFQEFVFIAGPQWNNRFDSWGTLSFGLGDNPDGINYYAENLGVLQAVHQILAAAGVKFKIVLNDEAFHIPVYDPAEYVARLWKDYVSEFGLADTCGVTIADALVPGDTTHEANQLKEFLTVVDAAGLGRPNFYCLNAGYAGFLRLHVALLSHGITALVPIVITSTALNDRTNAANLRAETVSSGRQILFLDQWFYNDPTVRQFDNYHAYGF